MRVVLFAAVFALSLTRAASAQAAKASTDVDLIVHNIYGRLFSGITLQPTEKAKVMAVIWQTQADQMAIRPSSTAYAQVTRLQEQRDSTLRAILADSASRAKFDEHASESRQAVSRPKP
jgi:hypothetical protein